MDKVVSKVKKVRGNWWEAFKVSIKIRGFNYYEPTAEVKYRFPAPGSCPQRPQDIPHLYKHDWKIPFKDSPFNIRDNVTKKFIPQEQSDTFASCHANTNFDPNNEKDARYMNLPDNAINNKGLDTTHHDEW